MSSGQKSNQWCVIQLSRQSTSAPHSKGEIHVDWRKNQQWEGWFSRVSAGRQLLAVLSTTAKKPNKSEVNSPEVEFDRKYAKMTAIAHLSLAASRSLYQEPGHGCTITAQKKNRDYQSIKQKTQQKARCQERVKANNEAIFLVLTATGLNTAT